MENYITTFDPIKSDVLKLQNFLENMVITTRETRDDAFEACKQANALRNKVDGRRKELLAPIALEKKNLKAQFEKDCEPLDKLKSDIEKYAQDELLSMLDSAIAKRKSSIIAWDDKMKREESERLQKIKDEEDRIQKEHLDALKKAEDAKGIAQTIAIAQAEKKVEEQKAIIEQEKIDLTSKKSGREKIVKKYSLLDIALVPYVFLKPREVDWKKVEAFGTDIAGILITEEKQLMFK